MGRLLAVTIVSALTLLAPGCAQRSDCFRDGQCDSDEVCYYDNQCLPREVAERAGTPPGRQCGIEGLTCAAPAYCRTGYCVGSPTADAAPPEGPAIDASTDHTPPTFTGLQGVAPDDDGVLLLYWEQPFDDTSNVDEIELLLYRGLSPTFALLFPLTIPPGSTVYRDESVQNGVTYYYTLRARDAAGNVASNSAVRSGTPEPYPEVSPGVDFTSDVLPILWTRCRECHGGSGGLTVDSYHLFVAGGSHGATVIPCDPARSTVMRKLGPKPPFGLRMPRTGPPYLPLHERATLERWIADGAGLFYNPLTCDLTPPTFAGITSLEPSSANSCTASWEAATDDSATAQEIRYRIYTAAFSGDQNFLVPVLTTAQGATSAELTELTEGQATYVVVRAVDLATNEDLNLVELSCML